MDDIDWLNAYIGIKSQDLPQSATSTPKTSKVARNPRKSTKGPWYPAFPSVDRVAAMRVQHFDNGASPGKGRVQHTLKVRVYFDDDKPLNQRKPDWERVIPLLDPKQVVDWAIAQHQAEALTDTQLEHYKRAKARLDDQIAREPSLLVKMGHVGSPPGTHYYHGQFVVVTCTQHGEMAATFDINGVEIELDRFHPNKRGRKPGAPVRHALYDPRGLIAGGQ